MSVNQTDPYGSYLISGAHYVTDFDIMTVLDEALKIRDTDGTPHWLHVKWNDSMEYRNVSIVSEGAEWDSHRGLSVPSYTFFFKDNILKPAVIPKKEITSVEVI